MPRAKKKERSLAMYEHIAALWRSAADFSMIYVP